MSALPNAPVIRMAVAEDWPDIMQLLVELHEENGEDDVDWPSVEEDVLRAINKDHGMIGVIGPVGAIEAATMTVFSKLWYGKTTILEERFLFVRPDFRRTGNLQALLQFNRSSAKKLKVKLLIGVMSRQRTAGKLRMYALKLGAPVGGYFFIEG